MKKIIIIIFPFLLSSCSNIKVQDYLYPISIGIDYNNSKYQIYMQLVSYSKISKKENESSFDESYEMIILNSEGNTIFDALTKLQNITKDNISTAHIRSFIIGESLIKNNSNYIEIIRAFFDNNYLRSNLNIFSTKSILDIYKASRIIDNTPYSNEINEPSTFRYLKPINYLHFLKSVYDNRCVYLPYIIVDKDSSSYVDDGEIKENYIIEINGAYYIYNNTFKYFNNEQLIGNFYFIKKQNARLEIKDKLYVDIKELKHTISYNNKIIFNIKLKKPTFYIYDINYEEAKNLIREKIKKEIYFTYNECYNEIDIFNLNDYKNRYNLNNEFDINIEIKNATINYSSRIK